MFPFRIERWMLTQRKQASRKVALHFLLNASYYQIFPSAEITISTFNNSYHQLMTASVV